LSPPEGARIESLASAVEFLDTLSLERFPFYGSWRSFAEVVAQMPSPEELESEYVRLFASGVDGALCPPTESYYRGQAMGGRIAAVVAEVERTYRRLGIGATNGSESPDHAAVEFEAMSVLCRREADAHVSEAFDEVVAAVRSQDRFLRGHLAIWIPQFHERVVKAPRVGPFYRTLNQAVHAFVVHDVDLVHLTRERLERAAA